MYILIRLVIVCWFIYFILNFFVVSFWHFFFFKQKTAYEMRISDWSSDVCSSDLARGQVAFVFRYVFPGVLVIRLNRRYGIGPLQPAVQIDIGTARRAERPLVNHDGFATDRTGPMGHGASGIRDRPGRPKTPRPRGLPRASPPQTGRTPCGE